MARTRHGWVAAFFVQLVLLAAVARAAAGAEPQQRSTQQGTSQQQRLSRKIPDDPKIRSTPDELNKLPCSSIRCSLDLEPVCATGKGVGGCTTPDKGCTYTNGCLARCVYSVKIAYMGECTHKNAMKIMEEGASAPTPIKDCKCPVNFQPVCDKGPACKIPGGCTYASECYAKCYGATNIQKGECKHTSG